MELDPLIFEANEERLNGQFSLTEIGALFRLIN